MGNLTTRTLTPANPALGTTDRVHVTTSLRLRFDRFLLPGEVIRQSICLQPKADPVTTLDNCDQGVFLEPSYDPVYRTATYRLPSQAALVADAKYWLTVLARTEESPFGMAAFDGAGLEETLVLQFTTAQTNPGGPVDPPMDDASKRAASEELFCTSSACVTACGADAACAAKCAVSRSLVTGCGYCHGRLESGAAVMGLDLSSPERFTSMIGRAANQTQTGADADQADSKPRRFGRAMPHVDPGNPGNSYLLYKMLIGPTYQRSAAASGMASGEIDRLRASVVVGLPMPPYEFSALPDAGMDALSAWILTGAQTPNVCP